MVPSVDGFGGAGRHVELLAPAGSMVALHAAVSAGADAVYLGLDSFNARRNAGNFTIETLRQACDYAHLRGVRVYVTLNIAILPSEIDRAIEMAESALEAGADAFIVQDLGVAARLKECLPEANLHVSTQMNTHSVAGIEAAALLGAKRVTLARELSIAEIEGLADVAAQLNMQVETFAHGALCVCYSGQCLMSSLIGGRSANRGLCAQACRLPYTLHAEGSSDPLPAPGEHLLSPQDLCAIDLLPQLVGAGVSSLKIEGRMKSPEYVHAVVGVYRRVLDRVLAGDFSGATEEEHRVLSEAFSRGFTTAYLESKRGNEIMSYGRPNNRGVFVGRVSCVQDRSVSIALEQRLTVGDVLEFWTNKGHFAHVLDQSTVFRKDEVVVRPDKAVGKGDRVFRVRSADAQFVDDPLEPCIDVSGRAVLKIGHPLLVEFWPAARGDEELLPIGRAQGDVVEAARTKAVSSEDVRSHIDRLGQTPFRLVDLDVQLDDGVGIGFSQLHRVRSAALDNLSRVLCQMGQATSGGVDRPLSISLPKEVRRDFPVAGDDPFIAAWVSNPDCARAAKRAGARVLYVPALNYKRGESACQGVRSDQATQAGYPKQVTIALPVANHDPVPGTREAALDFTPWRYVKEGRPVFVESLGDALRAMGEGALAEIGPHVPITNRHALRVVAGAGVSRVWLSPELTLGQIDEVAQGSAVPLGIVVAGAQELMITEHCLLMSQGPCNQRCGDCDRRSVRHRLTDRKGFDFPVVSDALGRSHLYNGVSLDIVHVLPDLLAAGLDAFMVDATLMTPEETAKTVSRAVKALDAALAGKKASPKPQGTTTGHLFRGVM